MKKLFILGFVAIGFFACGGSQSEPIQEDTTEEVVQPEAEQTEEVADAPGKMIIEKNDCATCHKDTEKLIGPAFSDIAGKYTDADIDKLAQTIIDGGKGNWGEVPMTPHPTVTPDDAKAMVSYILTIK